MSFPAQEVLITEHLTFAPLSLVDDIINTANALLYKSVSAMEQLFANLPAEIIPDEEVESGIHKFETLLESSVDRNFDAMELFVLRNITNIPEDLVGWIQLKHHEGLDFTTDESAELEEDLSKARKTLLASQKVKAMIDREQLINARKLAALDAHAEKLRFLNDKASEYGVDMSETMELLKTQSNELHVLLDETTNLSAAMPEVEQSERSKYIEQVLLSTVKEGRNDESSIGSLENLQAAAAALKR